MANIDRRKFNRGIDTWTLFQSTFTKRTAARIAVVKILQRADRPLSAEDIFSISADAPASASESASKFATKPLALATIYRTLQVLERIRFIKKVAPKNNQKNDRIYYEI